MSSPYLVLEGPKEIDLLKRFLPPAITASLRFIDGDGKYGAESLARSLAATRDVPVALLIDADMSDDLLVRQKYQDLTALIYMRSRGAPFELLLMVPTIESILFVDRSLLEQLLNQPLTDLEWQLGQKQPKDLLQAILGPDFWEIAFNRLSAEQIKQLQHHPTLQKLINFFTVNEIAA